MPSLFRISYLGVQRKHQRWHLLSIPHLAQIGASEAIHFPVISVAVRDHCCAALVSCTAR